MSNADKIRGVLSRGGAASGEVAAQTGLSVAYCSAVLHRWWKSGRLVRSESRVRQNGRPGAYRYTLASEEDQRKGRGLSNRRGWSDADRDHVVELRREGLSIMEIADRSPVPHGTIARWLSPRGMREWRA